jgi:hypothetical protein
LAIPFVTAAQPFGRFGHGETPFHDAIRFDERGIDSTGADRLDFVQELKDRRVYRVSPQAQTVGYPEMKDCPSKILVSLTAPGISVYAPKGVTFRSASIGAPYLTWSDGSVRESVPTPSVNWLAVTFAGNRPSYILGFPGKPAVAKITGKPGNWEVQISDREGWIRVGRVPGVLAANNAALLGQVKQAAQKVAWLFVQMPPELVKTTVEADENVVRVNWQFDRPGAIVPSPLYLAGLEGLRAKISTKTERIAATDDGPVEIVQGRNIEVEFPSKRIPTGRALGIGSPTTTPLASISSVDVPSVAELAMEAVLASRDLSVTSIAESAYTHYLSNSKFTEDTTTKLQLPFAANGQGADIAAAHALLFQVLVASKRAGSDKNSLLTSVNWAQDWATWKFWSTDDALARRASAFAAVTGAFCSEPERRLTATMFEFGLAADRGRYRWKHRRAKDPKPQTVLPDLIEPLWSIRKSVYGYANLAGPPERTEPFVQLLRSPLRVYSDSYLIVTREENGMQAAWSVQELKAASLSLAGMAPPEFKVQHNLTSITASSALGVIDVRFVPETTGVCRAKFTWPEWAPSLPSWTPPPPYSESPRAIDLR